MIRESRAHSSFRDLLTTMEVRVSLRTFQCQRGRLFQTITVNTVTEEIYTLTPLQHRIHGFRCYIGRDVYTKLTMFFNRCFA